MPTSPPIAPEPSPKIADPSPQAPPAVDLHAVMGALTSLTDLVRAQGDRLAAVEATQKDVASLHAASAAAATIDVAIRDGRATPAERDALIKLFAADAAAAGEMLAKRAPVDLSSPQLRSFAPQSAADDAIVAHARKLVDVEGISYAAAVARAQQETAK